MNNNKSNQLTDFDIWAALAYYGLNQENQHPILDEKLDLQII